MSRHRAEVVARRKSKLKRRELDRAARRSRLEAIIGLVGLEGRLGHSRVDILGILESESGPEPRVIPDPSRPRDLDLQAQAKVIQGRLDRVSIRVGDEDLRFNDYISVVRVLLGLLRAGAARRSLRDDLRGPATIVVEFVRRHDDQIWEACRRKILLALDEAGSIDSAIYTVRGELSRVGRGPRLALILRRYPVPCRTVEVDGVRRKAFRCGIFADLHSGEVKWIEWDASVLGPGAAGRLPVYVQSHALRQLRLRLDISPDHVVDFALQRSLEEPVLTPASGGAHLVEYRLAGHKLGYLVAEVIGDLVLVRTFLLMTMQGTPEGSELSRRVRLHRSDVEYLELDRLGTLIGTDLARDPVIAGLLRDCGCGEILDLIPMLGNDSVVEGYAEFLRNYAGSGNWNSPLSIE